MIERRILLHPSPACLAWPLSAGCAPRRRKPPRNEVEKTDAEWRAQLTPQQEILRSTAPSGRARARS